MCGGGEGRMWVLRTFLSGGVIVGVILFLFPFVGMDVFVKVIGFVGVFVCVGVDVLEWLMCRVECWPMGL